MEPALVLADFGMARRVSRDTRRHRYKSHERVNPMTALVCTAWYRPPELWAVTMDDHDVDRDFDVTTAYDSSLDLWSFGAVVDEVLSC